MDAAQVLQSAYFVAIGVASIKCQLIPVELVTPGTLHRMLVPGSL